MVGRTGELPVFCGGLLVVAASSAACAFVADYGQLLAFRAAGGLGSTMFTVSAASLLVRISPPAMRGRASGAWATGFLLGSIAGPVVGGGLIAGSLRAPFFAYAAMLVVTVLITGVLLRGAVRADPARPGVATVTFAAVVRQPTFRAALAANFVTGWTVYGVRVALVPLFVVEVLHRPDSWSGIALAASGAGTGATLLLGGRWADRRGRRRPILVGSATVAVTSLWVGLAGGMAELVVVSLVSGAGTGLMSAAVNASVTDVIAARGREERRLCVGRFQMVGDAGAIIGPIAAGVIRRRDRLFRGIRDDSRHCGRSLRVLVARADAQMSDR
jgi:MFS transporter, DHA1 family, tetracycline resistance protein